MTVTAPTSQRAAALREGNRIRSYRAQVIKPGLANGTLSLEAVFQDSDCASMRVEGVLRAIRGLGPVKVDRILVAHGVPVHARVEALSAEQRARLVRYAMPLGTGASGNRGCTSQSRSALAVANAVRRERQRLHYRIASLQSSEFSRAALAVALVDLDTRLLGPLWVHDVLKWARGVSDDGASRFMRACRIGSDRRVGQLTPRQLTDLGRCLRGDTWMVSDEAAQREAYGWGWWA